MKKGLKVSIVLVGIISLIAFLSVGLYVYLSTLDGGKTGSKPALAVKEQIAPKGGTFIEVIEKDKPDVKKEFPLGITEVAVQDAIHAMSHQKVLAEDKWGFVPLTKTRVERLIEIIEDGSGKYEHTDIYLSILTSWNKNDFSSVDQHHNDIWSLQSGTIGKATGILSTSQEKAFIEKHYDIQ